MATSPDLVVEATMNVHPEDLVHFRWSRKKRRPYKRDLERLIGRKLLDIICANRRLSPEDRKRARIRNVILRDQRDYGGALEGYVDYSVPADGYIVRESFVIETFGAGLSGIVRLKQD